MLEQKGVKRLKISLITLLAVILIIQIITLLGNIAFNEYIDESMRADTWYQQQSLNEEYQELSGILGLYQGLCYWSMLIIVFVLTGCVFYYTRKKRDN